MASRRIDQILTNPYRAQVTVNNRRVHLGYFPSKYLAERAEDEYREQLGRVKRRASALSW